MKLGNIKYSMDIKEFQGCKLGFFFEGWEIKPSDQVFRESLKNSYKAICAIDTEKNMIIGYITAISDGVLSSYIPFLEVDRRYQKQGIGSTLFKKMLEELNGLYMTDLVCDKEKAGFYEKAGMVRWNAMIIRRFEHQGGVQRKD